MNRGVVYIVWGDDHKEDLDASIASLLEYNDLPYEVIKLEGPSEHNMVKKIDVYNQTPFDSTLFLDADTIVLGDLDYGFVQAEKHGMAITHERASYARRWENYIPGWDVGDIIEYNTGVMFFTKNEKNKAFFEFWKSIAVQLLEDYNCTWNQPSFALAAHHADLNPFALPNNVWNLRDYDDGCLFGPVKIWHTRIQKMTEELKESLIQKHDWQFYNVKAREKLKRVEV